MEEHLNHIISVLDLSLLISEENKEYVEAEISGFINDSNNIFSFIELIENSERDTIRQAGAVYLKQTVMKCWESMDESMKMKACQRIIEVIQEEIPLGVLHVVIGTIILVFGYLNGEWNDLLSIVIKFCESNTKFEEAMMILESIYPIFSNEKKNEMKESLILFCSQSLSMKMSLKVFGVGLFASIVNNNPQDIKNGNYGFINSQIIDLAAQSKESPEHISAIWSGIGVLITNRIFNEDELSSVFNFSFNISMDESLDCKDRSHPLNALVPVIGDFPESAPKIFSTCLNICAQVIKEDEKLPKDMLAEFNDALKFFTHSDIYPIVLSILSENLESDSQEHQISALMVFRIILEAAPECAYKDISQIISFLIGALQSENPLLQEASCSVISTFDDSFMGLNMYSNQIFPNLYPLFIHSRPELRLMAYKAAESILGKTDSYIDGMFLSMMSFVDQIPDNDDDWIGFLTVLAYSITLSEEFDDESFDLAIEVLTSVAEKGELYRLSASLDVALALIRNDDSQAPSILEIVLPGIHTCFESGNKNLVFESASFLGNIAPLLREIGNDFLTTYIPLLNDLCVNHPSSFVKSGVIEALSKIARYVPSLKDSILPVLIDQLVLGLKSDKDLVLVASELGIRLMKKNLDTDIQKTVFDEVLLRIDSPSSDEDIIGDSFLTLSKILKYVSQDNQPAFLEKSVAVFHSLVNCTIPFMKNSEIALSPMFPHVSQPISHFLACLLRFKTDVADDICHYLLKWLDQGSDFESYDITGAFIEAIKTGIISSETTSLILSSVAKSMETTTEPSNQQNIVYFLNVLIQCYPDMIDNVISLLPIIEKWFREGKENVFGYQETLSNIASLFLEMSKRYPDFPIDYVNSALMYFPPADNLETMPMISSILEISRRSLPNNVKKAIALAIGRFIVWDDTSLEKARVTEPAKESLIDIFREFVSHDKSILKTLSQQFSKQRAKYRKLEAVI